MTFLDHLFGRPVTRDQLSTLRADRWSDGFHPPPPPAPAGRVDSQGTMVTAKDWAEYERARREGL